MSKFSSKEEFLAYVQDQLIKQKTIERKSHDDLWSNLPKFTDICKIPQLPVVEKELWESFYIPKLLEAGTISKKDLLDGHYYLGDHRRGKIAKWVAAENLFHYWREKWNSIFIDKCEHFEDYTPYSVFVPILEVSEEDWVLTSQINKPI